MSERRDGLSLGVLLRAAADDELSSGQRETLAAHLAEHPEDGARIEFERELRQRVASVMGADKAAPAGLRARVEGAVERPAVVATIGARRERRVSRRALALAASIVVVAGLLVALYTPSSPIGPEARYQASLVRHLDGEHNRCWVDAETILSKFDVREPEALPASMARVFGRDVAAPSVEAASAAGLEFLGAGECNVPGRARSMHFGFRTDGTRGEAGIAVSLFVQPDEVRLELAEGVTYRLTAERRMTRGACSIYAWTRDGMICFLVSDDAGACDLALEALDAPDVVHQL